MSLEIPQFSIGIEEEYLLVDKTTRSLAINPPKSLLKECKELLGNQVTNELLFHKLKLVQKYVTTYKRLVRISQDYVKI